MNSVFKEILKSNFNIVDITNFEFKLFPEKKVSNKKVRGSIRSQVGKFLPYDQFERNISFLKNNPLP